MLIISLNINSWENWSFVCNFRWMPGLEELTSWWLLFENLNDVVPVSVRQVKIMWGMYNQNPFKDARWWGCCKIRSNCHRHLDRSCIDAQLFVSHWQTFLGLLPRPLYHSLLHLNVQPLRTCFNGQKMWKFQGDKSGLYAGYLSTSHLLVLKCVGHLGVGVVV